MGESVQIDVIDPRSPFVYFILVFSHGARHGVPLRERLRTAMRGLAVASVIANGRLVAAGRIPSVEEVLAAVQSPAERPQGQELYAGR
ncbi:MAG: hypothetical protein ACOY93_12250 [Bacillota bacterium]